MKKDRGVRDLIKKPLYVAFISGIILVFLSISVNILMQFTSLTMFLPIYGFASLVFSVLFYYGFYVLGKRYNNAWMKNITVVLLVVTVLFFIFMLFGNVIFSNQIEGLNGVLASYNDSLIKAGIENVSNLTMEQQVALNDTITQLGNSFAKDMFVVLSPILIFLGGVLIIYIISSIFFGIALLKLKKEVELAKIAGILTIVGAATAVILVGILILSVAFVLYLMILFEQAKKFKEVKS